MDYRKQVAAIYLLGFFIDLVNMFITSVAYPDIGRALHASVAQLGWISTAYIAGLTVVMPFSARLAAYYGSKTVFIASLLTFFFASIAAGQADSIGALIAWRALQGLGGGLLIPLGQSMTYRLYRPAERPGLSSVIMLVGLLAPALSPAIGGVIVDGLSWRWIFYLNAPLAALALLLAARWLHPDPPRSAAPVRLDAQSAPDRRTAVARVDAGVSAGAGRIHGRQPAGRLVFARDPGHVGRRRRRADAALGAGLVLRDRADGKKLSPRGAAAAVSRRRAAAGGRHPDAGVRR